MRDDALRAVWAELEAEESIKMVLDRLFDLMCPSDRAPRLFELQEMTDSMLDRRPAACVVSLEHRLDCLRRALEALGPWAAPEVVVGHAVGLCDSLN